MQVIGHIEENNIKYTVTLVPVVRREIRLGDGDVSHVPYPLGHFPKGYVLKEDEHYDYMESSRGPGKMLMLPAKTLGEARKMAIEKLGDRYCAFCSIDRGGFYGEEPPEEEHEEEQEEYE